VTPPNVAEIVITEADVTAFVVTTNPAVVAPAGTVTLAGTATTAVLLLDTVTTAPTAGAAALSVIVPVDVPPPRTLVGWRLSDVSVGVPGVTVSCADWVTPPLVPEIVTVVAVVTALVATANVAVVPPAATVTPPGTVATAGLLLDRVTVTPPLGAAEDSMTVPVDVVPLVTLGGRLSDVSVAGPDTVTCARRVVVPVAEMVTVVNVAQFGHTVKLAAVLSAAKIRKRGTGTTAGLLLDSVTIAPPAGAAALSVTVPVNELPNVTPVGFRLRDVTAAGCGARAVAVQFSPSTRLNSPSRVNA